MVVEGVLRFVDVGMGAWLVESNHGKVALYGKVPRQLRDKAVRAVGATFEGVSAAMVGDSAMRVESVVALGDTAS
jgi:hypothetical protein